MKILIVDDEKTVCDSLERYFIKKGHEVQSVQDFKAAEAALLVEKFNLIFLDYRLTSQQTVFSSSTIKIFIFQPRTILEGADKGKRICTSVPLSTLEL